MVEDLSPWENLSKRRISKEIAEFMEGDLTMEKLHEAPFKHMNGKLSPYIDGFIDNYLRASWPLIKHITKDATHKDGLNQTLRSAILKLLRKVEKSPLEIGNYRPISIL